MTVDVFLCLMKVCYLHEGLARATEAGLPCPSTPLPCLSWLSASYLATALGSCASLRRPRMLVHCPLWGCSPCRRLVHIAYILSAALRV